MELRFIICRPLVWTNDLVAISHDPNLQIEDLEAWINEKEVIAGLQDIGQDFDHVQVSTFKSAYIVLVKETRRHFPQPLCENETKVGKFRRMKVNKGMSI